MQAAEFLVGDRRYTLAEMLHANRFDLEFVGWLQAATPGDTYAPNEPHPSPVQCVAKLGWEPSTIALQCPQESFFVRCSLPEGHTGECNFPVRRRWKCSYAFDVPFYADFTVPAESEEEAQRIIERLMHSGQLAQILDGHAEKDWSGADNDRVFVSDQEEDDDEQGMLETLAATAKIELPPQWAVPPAAPNPALALMRSVLKAQIALWDAQGALEEHFRTVEFKDIEVTEQSSSEPAGLYSDARSVDSADDAEILRIYQAVLAYGAAGGANVQPAKAEAGIEEHVASARSLARQAELSIRVAASSALGSQGATPAWIVLYDLIEPATKIHERLSLLGDLLKKGGAK